MNAVEIYEKASWDLEHSKITLGEFEERIKPLYDVEPAIRCKDCKYKDDCHKITLINQKTLRGENIEARHYLDYCSYGKRKEQENENGLENR